MDWTRRRVVAGGTSLTLAAVAGCLGGEGGEDDAASGGNETGERGNGSSEADGPDGNGTETRDAESALEGVDIEDHTGQDEVTIAVDPEGAGFDPAAFEIDPETFLVWEWEGRSTVPYPIDIPEGCIWDEEVDEETVEERSSGDEFDRLFTVPGAYLYGSRDADGEEFTGAFRVVEGDESDGM